MSGATPSPVCPNCGASGPAVEAARFCPECGQARHLHPPTLGEFVHEFITHYVALEGALWRTLALLLRQPGALTQQWLQGRRQHWVNPLRLYLTMSFLFFVGMALLPGEHKVLTVSNRPVAEAPAAAASNAASAEPREWFDERMDRTLADPARQDRFEQRVKAALPYVVFALVPLFAGWVALVTWRRRIAYGAHVVFALHVHAFSFFTAGLATLVDMWTALGWLLWLLVNPIHLTLALRRVYGGGLGVAGLRAATVLVLHTVATVAVTAGLLVALLAA